MSNEFTKRLLNAGSQYVDTEYSGLSIRDIERKRHYGDILPEEAEKLYKNYENFWDDFHAFIEYMIRKIPVSWMFTSSVTESANRFSAPNVRNHIKSVVLSHDEKINVSMIGAIHEPFVYFVEIYALPGGDKKHKLKFVMTISCRIGSPYKCESKDMYYGISSRYEVFCNTQEDVLDLYRKVVSKPTLPEAIKFMKSFNKESN